MWVRLHTYTHIYIYVCRISLSTCMSTGSYIHTLTGFTVTSIICMGEGVLFTFVGFTVVVLYLCIDHISTSLYGMPLPLIGVEVYFYTYLFHFSVPL